MLAEAEGAEALGAVADTSASSLGQEHTWKTLAPVVEVDIHSKVAEEDLEDKKKKLK